MTKESSSKTKFRDFPTTYWLIILFEFFERGAYYGMNSIISICMINELGFSKIETASIRGTVQPFLYFLPLLTGAIADRLGYRRMLFIAFSFLGTGYFLISQTSNYWAVFASMMIMGIGAGIFKPIIPGTISKVVDEKHSSLGFGTYYWAINLGAFIFPLIIVPYLKSMNWRYVLIASAISTGAMIIPTLLFFKEPQREKIENESLIETFSGIFKKIIMVFLDWRFMLFIIIYSLFWVLYFQQSDSVLWYVKDFVDTRPIDNFINGIFGTQWHFDVEHVTVINAGTIIALQLIISAMVKNLKALPTMIIGVATATVGMAILALSSNIWIFIAGMFIFSIGEMTAHPKYFAYLGMIAPEDKKATYTGFGFLYGFFGASVGSFLGAKLYVTFVDNPMYKFIGTKLSLINPASYLPSTATIAEALKIAEKAGISRSEIAASASTRELWLIFSAIGLISVIGLALYGKYIGEHKKG
ncbi:MAG: MFS transporter [Candidatus Kapabacteria bacterium]|nr:MFS transporter [Candidatus Kapabacteria bacterium]